MKPKDEGGLRIRNLVEMNKACLAKLTWNLKKGEKIYGATCLMVNTRA